MKFTLIFLSFLFSTYLYASEARQEVLKLLPEDLVQILGKDADIAEQQFKAKISKKEKEGTLYLKYFEKSGDVTLGIKDKVVVYVYAELPTAVSQKNPGLFKKALTWMTPEELEKQKEKISEDESHEAGRFFQLDYPKESLKLEFINNAQKTLHSVVIWKEGEKAP